MRIKTMPITILNNSVSYFTMFVALLIAVWCLKSLWSGSYQHILPFLCAITRFILEFHWILTHRSSDILNIANNFTDIGFMLSLWSYYTYDTAIKLFKKFDFQPICEKVLMPYFNREEFKLASETRTPEALLQAIKKAQYQCNKKVDLQKEQERID